MKILAIDTATELCSAALLVGGTIVSREIETARGHAEHILPMVDAVLAEAGVTLRGLDAIAFGRGPGAFTGVRLAAGVVQGLTFGAGLPVVAVSDLSAVAQRALDLDATLTHVLVCNDARMQQVYWACFERSEGGLASHVGKEFVASPADVRLPAGWISAEGAGRGFRIYAELRDLVTQAHENFLPRAAEIARLAAAEFAAGRALQPGEAIPTYLRDDIAKPPS